MKKYPLKKKRRGVFAAFAKRNGAYAAAAACLAVLGLAAVGLWAGPDDSQPARSSGDETLADVTSNAAQTPLPTAAVSTPAAVQPDKGVRTPVPTLVPDMTKAPEPSPSPEGRSLGASPVDGTLLRPYSMDALIWSVTLRQWMTHPGADIRAPKGTPVYAAGAGTVARVYADDLLGMTVEIDHGGGLSTLYCGLKQEVGVKEGDRVEARAELGEVGDTAISECAEESHLHFEVRLDGRPVDPEGFVLIKK